MGEGTASQRSFFSRPMGAITMPRDDMTSLKARTLPTVAILRPVRRHIRAPPLIATGCSTSWGTPRRHKPIDGQIYLKTSSEQRARPRARSNQKFGTVQSCVPPILLGLITRRDLFGIISGVR